MMAFRSGASGKGSRLRPSQAQSSMVHANDATSSDSGARVTPSSVERPMGFDNVFQLGQFKGKTYWDVLHRQPQFYVWAKKEGLCNGLASSLSSGAPASSLMSSPSIVMAAARKLAECVCALLPL